MSKKKKNRVRNITSDAQTRTQGAALAEEQKRSGKRLDPAARNLVFMDLIFLAVSELLTRQGIFSPLVSGTCTLLGVGFLLWALWLQFGKKKRNGPG